MESPSSSSSAPSGEELQQQINQLKQDVFTLQKQNEKLDDERDPLLGIAAQAVRILKLQRRTLQPEGFWIIEQDVPLMKKVQRLARRGEPVEDRRGGRR